MAYSQNEAIHAYKHVISHIVAKSMGKALVSKSYELTSLSVVI